jgi:hypothetical protein
MSNQYSNKNMCCEDLNSTVRAERAMAKFVMLAIHLEQTTEGQAKIETDKPKR